MKIRTKLLSILIWIIFLAAVGLYTTFYTGKLANDAYKTVSLKSAVNDLISSVSDINNILAFYSVSELSTTTTTTTTTTTDLKSKEEALKEEYKFATGRLNETIKSLKANKDFEERVQEISDASSIFILEANIIFDLVSKRLGEEIILVDIMGKVRENRHQISDVIKAGSRGSEKLKLDVADASYKEKEYNFQYKDKKHADEWLAAINGMIAGMGKEGFNNLIPFAQNYLEFSKKAIEKRTEIEDLRLNEKYHLDLIKDNVTNTNISISKITNSLDENLNKIIDRSAAQRNIFFSFIFAIFAISAISIFLITKSIIFSIDGLSRVARKVSVGDLTQRAVIGSQDEIGYLATIFNQMLNNVEHSRDDIIKSNEKLQEAYQEVEKVKISLEEKVRDRTKELEDIKDTLEIRVNEKTAELKERLEELEKFKKLTTGRELRMAELKERMEELEKQLAAK